jgi:stage II sporulation protein AA (anti-sigma F factor antagonist)
MEEELIITSAEMNDTILITLKGDLTKTSGEKLLDFHQWDLGLPNNLSILIISFEYVNYINSAGIAYMIRLCRLLNANNITIRAFGLEYHYEKMFSIVGLSRYLSHYPSQWAAVEGLESNNT